MNRKKKPLFRKVNTKARGIRHNFGDDFKNYRNSKSEKRQNIKGSMSRRRKRGLDYTPLFKFLLSKQDSLWAEVYSEAVSRLDKKDPIFWIVSIDENKKEEIIRVGESTYFSGMYVDKDGYLRVTNPKLKAINMEPNCNCCTHTFNGEKFGTE